MRAVAAPVFLALAAVAACGGQGERDDWWNRAWTARKRVRVSLPDIKPLALAWRKPTDEPTDDVVPAKAILACELPAKTTAKAQVRVVDRGGNLLPCVVSGPDARGLLEVVFPARHTIAGRLAEPIKETTKQVRLTVGRNKAVAPGMLFWVLSGAKRVATVEVREVEATASVARVIDKAAPMIDQGHPVRSQYLTDAHYHIYYANPSAKADGPTWSYPSEPVRQTTWRVGSAPTSVEQLQSLMESGPTLVGATQRSSINSRANPLGSPGESYLLNAYESFVHVRHDGLCRFSCDTDGPSILFINGRQTVLRPGFFIHSRQWEHRGKVSLQAGYHHLLLFAIESSSRGVVTRLGWQPITAKVFSPAPESLYAAVVEAEVMGYETLERRRRAFFTCRLAESSLLADGKKRYQFVQFLNRSSLQPTTGKSDLTYAWDFGDGERSRRVNPGHLYAVAGRASPPAFGVTLRAYVAGRLAGQYQRTVYCEPRAPVKLKLWPEIVSFANVAYADERTSMAVRLHNLTRSPVVLRAVGLVCRGDDKQIVLRRRIFIPAEDESFCIVPIDLKELPEKRAEIHVRFYLGSDEVQSTSARVIPSPQHLSRLSARRGALYDRQGRRVMICAEIEDPDRHHRWVLPRFVRDVYNKTAGTRRRIVLFGARMANQTAPQTPFTDYVDVLASRLKAQGRTLEVVPRTPGLLPTLPDIVRLAKTLDRLTPLPDILVISPGLADVEQATGVRNFVRSIDVMIDAVRATGAPVKLVIVSPPPYPTNPRLSALYTQELRRLARVHHIPFVHLGELLMPGGDESRLRAHFAAPHARGILLRYPNERAHRLIAEAILAQLR